MNTRSTEPHLTTIMVSGFDLRYPPDCGTRQLPLRLPSLTSPMFLVAALRNLWRARSASVLFASNPKKEELLFIFLAKTLRGKRMRTLVFDLIMRSPDTRSGRLLMRIKRRFLLSIDVFIFIHKDISGYEHCYGIPRERCRYVPFKANNFDLADKIPTKDGDYAVALGASQRDYQLLVDAIAPSGIPLKIVLPEASIKAHGAHIGHNLLPGNVEHVKHRVDRLAWSRYMAESRLVVIPILPGTIQPAGISVYLEAMILGKPVVITRGASTEGILHEDLAVAVPPGDAQALRSAITRVWNDGDLRRKLAINGKRYALSLGNHERLLGDIRAIVQRHHPPHAPGPDPL